MLNPLCVRPRTHHQALVLNEAGEILLVETARRTALALPGGGADRSEPPHLAARRHLEAASGLVRSLHCILVVDYVGARPFHFVHCGGQVAADQVESVARRRALHWVDEERLLDVVAPDEHRRISHALAFQAWGSMLPALVHGMRP
ncbi:NUDIX domain-containing protein [Kitasatospora sp. NPDC087861]|uniref:NUDIX domain-containing protein n=1 Tax=Kitasatospora sp. NPDC087861 TaxID=3364070 RepID=UPI003827F45F